MFNPRSSPQFKIGGGQILGRTLSPAEGDYVTVPLEPEDAEVEQMPAERRALLIQELEAQMREAARKFEFERAAAYRDRLKRLKELDLEQSGAECAEVTN